MPKSVVLNRTTLRGDGGLELEWLLQYVEADGTPVTNMHGNVIQEKMSRIVDPDGDYAANIEDVCNALADGGFTTDKAQRDRMKHIVGTLDTLARNDTTIAAERERAVKRKTDALAALDAVKPEQAKKA